VDIGLLWFDDDPQRSLTEKVTRAAAHYQQRFGRRPTLCYVNPATLGHAAEPAVAGVQLAAGRTVLPNHFWIGVGD
jgi:hypothetical protein